MGKFRPPPSSSLWLRNRVRRRRRRRRRQKYTAQRRAAGRQFKPSRATNVADWAARENFSARRGGRSTLLMQASIWTANDAGRSPITAVTRRPLPVILGTAADRLAGREKRLRRQSDLFIARRVKRWALIDNCR